MKPESPQEIGEMPEKTEQETRRSRDRGLGEAETSARGPGSGDRRVVERDGHGDAAVTGA